MLGLIWVRNIKCFYMEGYRLVVQGCSNCCTVLVPYIEESGKEVLQLLESGEVGSFSCLSSKYVEKGCEIVDRSSVRVFP